VKIFCAAAAAHGDQLFTAGGRVLSVTAAAKNADLARELAYRAAARVKFGGMHYRRDIGA